MRFWRRLTPSNCQTVWKSTTGTREMTAKIYAGERIRRLRETRGISQAALATAVGLSTSYLNQIENNQRPLSAAADILSMQFTHQF